MENFNLLPVDWTTRKSRAPGSKLIDLINTNSLQQPVNELTKQNNILDLVMTIPDFRIIELEMTDKISDHHMITPCSHRGRVVYGLSHVSGPCLVQKDCGFETRP
ncbi:Endonuclease/exonuclease/phosphatase [Trinorchestia longiramus]|nr:Endonuclease/exonuclease/phosphatase [Trinorchestia longiramus]